MPRCLRIENALALCVVACVVACAVGCRSLLGIDDPVLIDGDIIPGVELSSFELSEGELARPFEPLEASLSASLALSTESLSITATVASAGLTIYLEGAEIFSGEPSPSIAFAPGQSVVLVQVRRASSGEESTYTLTLDRAPRLGAVLGGEGDFGDAFAGAIQLDDDLIFVGAPCASAAGQSRAGRVYIFRLSDDAWSLETQIEAPTPVANQFFGASLSHDGGRLAVGADEVARCGAEPSPPARTGRAFVFEEDGGAWNPFELLPSDAGAGAEFGAAVAVDGDFVAASAPRQLVDGVERAGAVYLFFCDASSCTQTDQITAANGVAGDLFGADIDFNSGTLAVGAPRHVGGAVFLYANQSGTAVLTEAVRPGDQEINVLGPLDFGHSVVHDDDQLAVGGPASASGEGAVWIFAIEPGGTSFEALIRPTRRDEGDRFGHAVDIEGDLVVVGSPGEDSANAGAGENNSSPNSGLVSLFARTEDGWQEVSRLKPSLGAASASFGAAVDIDEFRVLGAAPDEREGYVYFFE